jgi:hypothetical protein
MLLLMNIWGAETPNDVVSGIDTEFEGGGEISVSCEADCSYLFSLVKMISIFSIKSCGIGKNLFSTILGWGNMSICA